MSKEFDESQNIEDSDQPLDAYISVINTGRIEKGRASFDDVPDEFDDKEAQRDYNGDPIVHIELAGYTVNGLSRRLRATGRDGRHILVPKLDKKGELEMSTMYFRNLSSPELQVQVYKDGARYKLDLPKGVIVIMGPSNSGKSLIANALREQLGGTKIGFHEPDSWTIMNPANAIAALENFMISPAAACVLDSGRFFLYNSDRKAAAVTGGISTSLFTDITNLSNVARAHGKTVIMVLNFLSQTPDSKASMLNAMIGAASGVIDTNNISDVGFFHFSGRTEQNKRQETLFSIELEDRQASGSNDDSSDHTNSAAISAIFDIASRKSHSDILSALKQLKN